MTEPTPTPPGKTYIPLVTDLMNVLKVLFAPTSVFTDQQAKPAWFMPWIAVSLFCVAIGAVNLPYSDRVMEVTIATRGGPEISAGVRTFAHVAALVGAPITLIIIGLISALILWVTLMLTGAKVRYRGLLSVVVFTESLAIVQILLQAVAMRMRGTPEEAIKTIADARVSFGLDLLIPADATISGFVRGLLMGIGPIQIWGLFITAIGIMVVEKQPKGAAWTAAMVSFFFGLLITAAFAAKTLGS